MSEIYRLPDDVTSLTDEDLEQHLSVAVKSFKAESATTVVTPSTLPNLRSLKASIEALKEEQDGRAAAAEAAAAEIDALSAEVFGEPETVVEEPAEGEELAAETEPEGEPAAEVIEPTAVVTASGVRRSTINLAAVRAKSGGTLTRFNQPDPTEHGVEILAAVDVPGFRPGQKFELEDITEGVMRRANGLKTAGGGVGMVASYKLPFSSDVTIDDSSAIPEGSKALSVAVDQRRLQGGDLVASGGWCAPSETLYDIVDIACPDMLFDAPEVQLNRGGLRFFRPPALDVNALTWVHTEQDDIAGNVKPCFQIPCAAPIDVRCDAVGVCLEAGILTQRFFPEMIDWYVRNSIVAHEIRMKARAYDQARAAATDVAIPATFGAFSAVYAAVGLQAADMIERYNLCDTISLEVVFPWWLRNAFMADIARQQGVKPADLNPNIIQDAFTGLGVRVQWARGLAPDVPTNIGGATAATAWPADMEFLIYPAGNFVLGRGAEVNIGVIIDSVTVSTNDEKIFSEECAVLIDRLGLARQVTVPICPTGTVGAAPTTSIACPVA